MTPDFSLFSKTRKKIGPEELGALFAKMGDPLRAHGYMTEVFKFVDASHLVSKAALWDERDEGFKRMINGLEDKTQRWMRMQSVKKLWMLRLRFTRLSCSVTLISAHKSVTLWLCF